MADEFWSWDLNKRKEVRYIHKDLRELAETCDIKLERDGKIILIYPWRNATIGPFKTLEEVIRWWLKIKREFEEE